MQTAKHTNVVIDIEANGFLLEADAIWCVVAEDFETGDVRVFTESQNLEKYLNSFDRVWGHNLIAYDMPVLERVWGVRVCPSKLYDTVLLSRMLCPDRQGGHSLKSWGETFNFPKGDHVDFSKYTKEMLEYCKQDVKITKKILDHFFPYINKFKKAIDIDRRFAYYMSLQQKNGFTLDLVFINDLVKDLEENKEELIGDIRKIVPPVIVYSPTYKSAKKEGRIIKEDDKTFTYVTEKTKTIKTAEHKTAEFNPNSRQQIADYLKRTYNWTPKVFTEKGAPDLSEKTLKTLPYKETKVLSKIIRLTKQLGMIKDGQNAWLKMLNEDGRVRGAVTVNGAVGGRCTHGQPNMSQVDKKDLRMRECWVPRPGWSLVGCDASGLELRMLAHYLHTWDKGAYTHIILNGDIHSYNQKAMGLNLRNTAKTAIYGLIYGAGNEKLGQIVMEDLDQVTDNPNKLIDLGDRIRNKVKDEIVGYSELMTLIEDTLTNRKYLIGIDGRPLIPRNSYSALNLLLQSAGASVMKQALNNFMVAMEEEKGYTHGVKFALCANIHDEAQIECLSDIAEEIGETFKKAIEKVTQDFNLKCPLTGEYMIGRNWKETH